jgi:hypothetical protein
MLIIPNPDTLICPALFCPPGQPSSQLYHTITNPTHKICTMTISAIASACPPSQAFFLFHLGLNPLQKPNVKKYFEFSG